MVMFPLFCSISYLSTLKDGKVTSLRTVLMLQVPKGKRGLMKVMRTTENHVNCLWRSGSSAIYKVVSRRAMHFSVVALCTPSADKSFSNGMLSELYQWESCLKNYHE
jgi:hypothetical protein